ncbi:MAG: B12-binding domain-containing radical SAM protein, partial [Actinomycetota bacterium]|nr:B12-binding domain-containing radical SAM protein [Actinomycetota bacterium]
MAPDDLWERVEPLLGRVERPARYIDREWGARHVAGADYRAVLIYPDTYEIGQANQGLSILYERLNGLPDVAAERCYVPWVDMS